MGEAHQVLQLTILDNDEGKPVEHQTVMESKVCRWLRITAYAILVVVGQAVATLLGRLYFTKGGKSKWLGTVVQLIGFPLLIPLYFVLPSKQLSRHHEDHHKPPSQKLLALIYVALGLLCAGSTLLYTVGLQYLPVTTYTLLSATQLAFNALTSFFLNGQKFTPYVVNSLVLLTISSTLLVFQQSDDTDTNTVVSRGKYALGFICTTLASAGYAFSLSLSQLVFTRVLKGRGNFKFILDMIVYESLVASFATLIGLFASGEFRTLHQEMDMYELGKFSYIMTLVWTALLWELFSIGAVGLIFEVSSLYSNVIDTFGLPVTPVLAVIFLHDKMDGITGIAMALAVWGFVSYAYQQYHDEYKSGTDKKDKNEDREPSLDEKH